MLGGTRILNQSIKHALTRLIKSSPQTHGIEASTLKSMANTSPSISWSRHAVHP